MAPAIFAHIHWKKQIPIFENCSNIVIVIPNNVFFWVATVSEWEIREYSIASIVARLILASF